MTGGKMCIVGRSDLSSPLAEVTGLNCLNSMQLQAGRGGAWGWEGGADKNAGEQIFFVCVCIS